MITVFIPGRLVNPLNGSHGHWSKHRRWAKDWRERTATHLWVAMPRPIPARVAEKTRLATVPKVVTFAAQTWNTMDDDNLRAALKPVRDALKDMRVIDDDSPKAGHTFIYQQRIDRKHPGVTITIDARPA